MAALEDEDIVEDDHFSAVLSFPPEVQEAIDQVTIDCLTLRGASVAEYSFPKCTEKYLYGVLSEVLVDWDK